ncbi:MAG: apolipoprotein N-acyltransferase [Nitrospiria bacterium]
MAQKIKLKDILLAVLTGFLLVLSFPKWDMEEFAWVAFIPLFFAIENKNPLQAFYLGWVSGLIFFFGSLNWIISTIVTYGHISWLTGLLAFLLMIFILASYPGIFSWGIRFCSNTIPIPKAILNPILWTGLEFLRGHFFIPFPWDSLGYSQYRHLWLIQFADLTSVYGISFLIILINTVIFEVIFIFFYHGKLEKFPFVFSWVPIIAAFFLLIAILAYGKIRLVLPNNGKTVKVSVIQGNIDQNKKWDERYRNETLSNYETLSRKAAENHPDVILWPETSVPFLFEREREYRESLCQFVKSLHIPLLFGSPALDKTPSGNEWFNSAYLINSDGILVDRYDKINLVPFGEYIPFQSILFFVNKLTEGIGDFKGGNRPTVFALPEHPFGTLICFEVIFPELFRKFVNQGAVFMTTITNDAWFGDTSAPYQHLSMVVFRAVENRTPIARAANTGISGFIDSRGNVLATTSLFVPDQITVDLKYYEERTFYTQYGDIFGWSVLSACILLIGFALMKRKNDVG